MLGSVGGILMFTLAAQQNLTISGLLLQMAYGVSALLAILFLGERSTTTQRFGFVAAATAIVLVSVG
jgi:EamA domain-containing membrane protein RarD